MPLCSESTADLKIPLKVSALYPSVCAARVSTGISIYTDESRYPEKLIEYAIHLAKLKKIINTVCLKPG